MVKGWNSLDDTAGMQISQYWPAWYLEIHRAGEL